MKVFYIITFENTHSAISAESILKNNNVQVDIMPTPTIITKSCGISIKVNDDFIEQVVKLVQSKKLIVKNIYIKNETEYKIFNI